MARTKQTARKTMAMKAPRAQLKEKKIKKGGPKNKAMNDLESESDQDDVINTQQFSLRFDDQ